MAEVRISRGLGGFRAFSMAEALQRRRAAGAGRKTLRLTPHGILRLRPTACAQDDNLNPTSCGRDDRTGRCSPRLAEGGARSQRFFAPNEKAEGKGGSLRLQARRIARREELPPPGKQNRDRKPCNDRGTTAYPLGIRSLDRFAFDGSYIKLTIVTTQYELAKAYISFTSQPTAPSAAERRPAPRGRPARTKKGPRPSRTRPFPVVTWIDDLQPAARHSATRRGADSDYSAQSWMTASMLLPSGSYTNAA